MRVAPLQGSPRCRGRGAAPDRLTGLSPRWARWVAVGIGLAFAAAMITLVVIRRQSPETPVGLIAGVAAVVTFGLALIGSRIWRRVYRAEMRLHR